MHSAAATKGGGGEEDEVSTGDRSAEPRLSGWCVQDNVDGGMRGGSGGQKQLSASSVRFGAANLRMRRVRALANFFFFCQKTARARVSPAVLLCLSR